MAILSLLARLNLEKSGFDAAIASASKTVSKFGTDMTRRLGRAFGAAAIISAVYKIGQAFRDVAKDSEAVNKELERIGQGLTQSDINLVKEYTNSWDLLLTKLKFVGLQIGLIVADVHETGAESLNNLRDYISAVFNLDKDPRGIMERIRAVSFRKEGRDLGARNLGEPLPGANERDLTIKRRLEEAKAHMAIQDRILDMEKEAGEINEKTRISKLTTEERIAELKREQLRLQKEIDAPVFPGGDEERIPRLRLQLAKTDSEIQQLSLKQRPQLGENIRQSGGAPGIFLGALRGGEGGGPARTNDLLSNIQRLLQSRGIVIRRTK